MDNFRLGQEFDRLARRASSAGPGQRILALFDLLVYIRDHGVPLELAMNAAIRIRTACGLTLEEAIRTMHRAYDGNNTPPTAETTEHFVRFTTPSNTPGVDEWAIGDYPVTRFENGRVYIETSESGFEMNADQLRRAIRQSLQMPDLHIDARVVTRSETQGTRSHPFPPAAMAAAKRFGVDIND